MKFLLNLVFLILVIQGFASTSFAENVVRDRHLSKASKSKGRKGSKFLASLSGDEEVPPVITDVMGSATFHANKEKTAIDFHLRVKESSTPPVGLLGAAGAHIHCAPPGKNGPVVAFLAGVVGGGLTGTVSAGGTLTNANIVDPACGSTIAELIQSMMDGEAYVNVHSLDNPAGEVRGTITSH